MHEGDAKLNKTKLTIAYLEKVRELLNEDCRINSGDFIPNNIIQYLKDNPSYIEYAFTGEKLGGGESKKFYIQQNCSVCDKEKIIEVNKTTLVNIIRGKQHYTCDHCKELLKIEKERESAIQDENSKKLLNQNTEDYINYYLNPDNSWKPNCKLSEKQKTITMYFINDNKIENYIKGLNYKDFLNTPYWSAISQMVKHKSKYKCALCGSNERLNVHHKTYTHHGLEHRYYTEDLICLCEKCHAKFHDKLEV